MTKPTQFSKHFWEMVLVIVFAAGSLAGGIFVVTEWGWPTELVLWMLALWCVGLYHLGHRHGTIESNSASGRSDPCVRGPDGTAAYGPTSNSASPYDQF